MFAVRVDKAVNVQISLKQVWVNTSASINLCS